MKRILFSLVMAVATMAATSQEMSLNASSNDGVIKTTNTSYAIKYFEAIKKYCPKTYFDILVNEQLKTGITNYYFLDKLPQDTIEVLDTMNIEMIDACKKEFAGLDFEKYDKVQVTSLSLNVEFIQMKRGEFWNEVFKIHRKYANPDGFVLIENHIKEVQTALGLKDADAVFVKKDALKEVEMTVRHIFTEMRNEVNTAYLK